MEEIMAKSPETFVDIKKMSKNQILVNAVLSKEQLKEFVNILELYSREWRGQYQSMMKGLIYG